MKFSDYFEEWLNGNYYAKATPIGKKGDFYTAVSVGSLFGICIAKRILELANNFEGKIFVVEIGANEGYLLADIIQGIFTFSPERLANFEFAIIEPHENLRDLQNKNFKKRFGDEVKISHFSSFDKAKFKNAIFIANELFDAFKCEILDIDKILFIENHKYEFKKADDEILDFAQKFKIKKGEIPLGYFDFANNMRKSAENFAFIAFDYGQMRAKNDFSLRVYKKHEVFDFFEIENLSEFYGVSDITYDVNFEILKAAFEENSSKMFDFKKQSTALVDFGAVEILEMFLKHSKTAYENAKLQLIHLLNEFSRFNMIEFRG